MNDDPQVYRNLELQLFNEMHSSVSRHLILMVT
jgi:hypothetical protein